MSGVYFIEISVVLTRPMGIKLGKKIRRKILRRADASIPITKGVDDAREMMDRLAQGLTELFQEISDRDQSERKAHQAGRGDTGRSVGSGDHGSDVDPETLPEP